jgi:CTP synthase
VGKYVELPDAYKSINESLIHASAYNDRKLKLELIHSEKLTAENAIDLLSDMDGILIAPGFGNRGIEGKIEAIRFAREHDIPCLGICLGMQCMVIEFGRNVLGFADANSTEFDLNTRHNVIDMMEEQKTILNMGGTMRLGAYPCNLEHGTLAYNVYGKDTIKERHRHRYEFNNDYREQYEQAGVKCSGINPESNLVEIIEIPSKKWFIGTQFHPEYSSTVLNPHPLFVNFIKAAIH